MVVHVCCYVVPGELLVLHGGPEAALHDLVVGADGDAGEVNIPPEHLVSREIFLQYFLHREVPRVEAGAGGVVYVFIDSFREHDN